MSIEIKVRYKPSEMVHIGDGDNGSHTYVRGKILRDKLTTAEPIEGGCVAMIDNKHYTLRGMTTQDLITIASRIELDNGKLASEQVQR